MPAEIIDIEVESTQCEDYPCCGHGPAPYGDDGGCPVMFTDGTMRYYCSAKCGKLLSTDATSSLCIDCTKSIYDADGEGEYREMMQEEYDDVYARH